MLEQVAMRILVIEDDGKIAELVVKGLRQVGYEAEHAADGKTGLDRLREPGWAAAVVESCCPSSTA
jgi:two-component system OmpR family response regulator